MTRFRRPLLAILIMGLAFATACTGVGSRPAPTVPSTVASPSPIPALTGQVTRAQVEAHPGWETLRASSYSPDPGQVQTIRENLDGIEVLVFLGTWCGDCKRELPRFFAIADASGLAMDRVTLYGVDRTKKDAAGWTERWEVKFVPTLIFLREGQEVGRIVERPKGSLERDIAEILEACAPVEKPGAGCAVPQ